MYDFAELLNGGSMGGMFARLVMAVFFSVLFAASAESAQLKAVYLKDGGIIDCEAFWKTDGKVMVRVNRDVLLDLQKDEVDLTRTFAGKPPLKAKKKMKVRRKKAPSSLVQPSAVVPAENVSAVKGVPGKPDVQPAAKPSVQAAATSAKKSAPVAGTAQPVKPSPPPAVKPAPKPPEALQPVKIEASPTFGIGVLIGALLFLLVIIASCWKMYEKAGVAGWKAIVPFYNMYVLVQIAGKPWWWFLLMFVPVVGVVIALLVCLSLAERFGKGTLFGIGLFFLGFIFIPILAFGKARYA